MRLHWCPAASDELAGELLELGTGQALLDVLGAGGIGRDEGQGNLGLTRAKNTEKLMAVKAACCFSARLLHTGELDLGLLCSLRQALQCLPVLEEVDALRRLSLTVSLSKHQTLQSSSYLVLHCPASVFWKSSASQSTMTLSKSSPPRWVSPLVASTSQTPSPTSQHRDVEGSSSEIEDQNRLVVRLLQAICQGGSSRLVHNSQHVQTSNLPGILRGLN